MRSKTYLTEQGLLRARAELGRLEDDRLVLLQELEDIRSLVRSPEANEYLRVKEELALLERKITDLEHLLRNAETIENVNTEKVSIGAKVKLKYLAEGKIKTYFIVDTHEANPFEDKISDESPVARALLGSKVNDVVNVMLRPNVFQQIKILGISA